MFCPVFETLHMSQRETDDTNPIFTLLINWLTDWLAGWLRLTDSLTPHSTVPPQNQTVPQLVKKSPIFYGTWKFITTFTIAVHLSTFFARLIHSIPSHPIDLRSILILSSPVHVFQVVCLLKVSPPKLCMHFSSPPVCHMHCPSHPSWSDHLNNTWWAVPIMVVLIMQFSLVSCYIFLLGPNISLWSFLNEWGVCQYCAPQTAATHTAVWHSLLCGRIVTTCWREQGTVILCQTVPTAKSVMFLHIWFNL